jgi:pyrimidine deaminase RibD-like protein
MSLKLATKLAQSNTTYSRWPLGCVITKGGAVQSVGWSSLKSDPRFERCSVHAEEHALRQMRYEANGCVLYVARLLRTGHLALAKPCAACQTLIRQAGVKRVVYTISDNEWGTWKP